MALKKISAKDISVSLDEHQILKGISTNFNSSELTVIIGPNAAGKSIFAKTLCFLLPYSGRIFWDGELTENSLEYRRRASYLSQSPFFFKGNVESNLSLPLKIRGFSNMETSKLVKDMLKDFNLKELLNSNPRKLSVGQRQKLGVIRAMITSPDLLILDEPTSSMDPETKRWIEDTILSLHKEMSSVLLWITHDLIQAKRMADKLLVIQKGKIFIEGDFDQIIQHESFSTLRRDLSVIF